MRFEDATAGEDTVSAPRENLQEYSADATSNPYPRNTSESAPEAGPTEGLVTSRLSHPAVNRNTAWCAPSLSTKGTVRRAPPDVRTMDRTAFPARPSHTGVRHTKCLSSSTSAYATASNPDSEKTHS